MSEQEPQPLDPNEPTEVDAGAAFAMGANSTNPSAMAGWKPPEPSELDPLLPNYSVEKLLGRGGMGAVYKAIQKNLKRPVAIKLLPAEMAQADPSFAERFRREAQAMAALDHPNIVTVFDFGETSAGHYYFVMEYVDGMDFHQLIHSNQLDAVGALNAVSQICDALEYAHSKGYVHRDIKPANIFINQSGILKVGDFGLAKMITSDEPVSSVKEAHLTRTGISMGTPIYSAPEQMDGRPVDQRADIYSLGVMFYEMLTHELPRGRFPPPSQKVQVDVRLDQVVLKAMESEPEMRYASATEMRTEVDEVRSGETASQPVAGKKPNGLALWVSLIGVVGLAVAAFFFIRPQLKEETEKAVKPSLPARPAEEHALHPVEANPPTKIESIAGGQGRPVLVDLFPDNDVEFNSLPPELDGVISAAILPADPKITYFVRKNGRLWMRKDTNEHWIHEASSVRDVLCTYRPYAITEAGDLIRPTYGQGRRWQVHAAGPWIDVAPGMGMLVGINRDRKLVSIPSFADDQEKHSRRFRLPEFENATQVSLGGGTGMVMDQEGNWREWGWNALKGLQNPDYSLKMKSVGAGGDMDLAITHDGKVVMYRAKPSSDIRGQLESIRDAEAIFSASGAQGAFAIRLKGNRWRVLFKSDKGLKIVDPAITDALTGCREVALIQEVAIGLRDLPEEEPEIPSIANGKGRPTILSLDPAVPDPQVPPEFDGIVAASVPPEHRETLVRDHRTCFVRKDGTGWDFNAYTNRLIHKMDGVRDVALNGADHCWLSEGGEMIPWPGTHEDKIHAIPKGPFSRLEAGHTVYFGLGSAGDIAAWPVNEHPLKHPPELESVVDLDGGKKHAIALTEDGDVVCWGVGFEGSTTVPLALKNVRVVSVGAVDDGSIAITESGEVVSWGGGIRPELKAALDSITDAEKVFTESAGQKALAIKRTGKKWFVWVNFKGNGYALPPEQLAKLEGCDEVALGGRFVVGLRDLPIVDDPRGVKETQPEPEGDPSPILGSLRGWSADPNYPVDLSKAEGIDDFVQVIAVQHPWDENQPSFGWAALMANGQVVSSSGRGEELTNVTRLIEGRHSFGAILKDGSVVSYDNHGSAHTVLPSGTHPVDAAMTAGKGLAIDGDGRLRMWGMEKWPPPPAGLLSRRIRDVGVTPPFVCVLTDEGRIVVWGQEGELELPAVMLEGVDEMVVMDNVRIAFRKGNDVRVYQVDKDDVRPVVGTPDSIQGFKLAHEVLLMEGEDGERVVWGKGVERCRQIGRLLSELPETAPYAVWIYTKVDLIFHLEPKAPIDPNPKIEGRLRAWASPESDLRFDVSKAEGIDDFTQVIQVVSGSGNYTESTDWAALRANGRIVSSNGRSETVENAVKLIPCAISFGAITEDGRAIYLRESEPEYAPLEIGERAVDGAFAGSHGLVILEDGSLKHWGQKYEGSDAWPPPPTGVLNSRIASVQASGLHALAVTEGGDLFVWGKDGLVELPEEIRTGIDDLDGNQMAGFAVRKGGAAWNYLILQQRLKRLELPDGKPVARLHTQARIHHLIEGTDGEFHIPVGPFEALSGRLSKLPKNVPHAAAAIDRDGTRVEMLLYIEP
tara:strand:+ start:6180 stop:10934 length:4755 start_codon:yes stop_codon:yes gene_type:complete